MKFLIIFALALASASALESRNVVPVVEPEGRIANGNTASVEQFPYQVGLSLKVGIFSSKWCGGSLIGNQWVLTAAHCTDGVSKITVYLGATVRTAAVITHTVTRKDVIIHSDWDIENYRNDISLIKIPSVTYTAKIQPVVIPSIASTYSTYVGDYGIASGWGRISDSATGVTKNLQWARLQIVTNKACAFVYGIPYVTSSTLCVYTPGYVSTCNGDSGGPLVLESSRVQVGLTSFGAVAGCAKGYPVAFTRLTSFLDWIKGNTGISY